MTEETALVPRSESFQGIPVRIVEVDGNEMIPVVDIARSLNIDRSNLSKTLKKNSDLLREHQGVVKITTPHGSQKMVCVSEFGAIGLLYKITASDSKDPEIKKRIVKFQKWATELIQKKMQVQTKIVKESPQAEGWSTVVIEYLNFAKGLMEHNPNLDLGMCMAIGIRQAEKATGMDLTPYKKLIPPAAKGRGEEYLTATAIGRIVDKSAKEVNQYLERTGYLYRSEDGTYYLTTAGAQHGKVFPGAFESGHLGYFIMWRRSILSAARMRENSPHRIREY